MQRGGYPILMTKKNDLTLIFSHSKLKKDIADCYLLFTDCSLHMTDYKFYISVCKMQFATASHLNLNVKPNLELNLKLNLELNVKLCKQCRGGATPFWWPRRMTWHLPFLIVNWKLHTTYCKLLFTVSRFQIAVYILQITQ